MAAKPVQQIAQCNLLRSIVVVAGCFVHARIIVGIMATRQNAGPWSLWITVVFVVGILVEPTMFAFVIAACFAGFSCRCFVVDQAASLC